MSIYCLFFANVEGMSDKDNPKHSINATVEGIVIDLIYIRQAGNPHSLNLSLCYLWCVWPGLSPIALYLALNAKSLNAPTLLR